MNATEPRPLYTLGFEPLCKSSINSASRLGPALPFQPCGCPRLLNEAALDSYELTGGRRTECRPLPYPERQKYQHSGSRPVGLS